MARQNGNPKSSGTTAKSKPSKPSGVKKKVQTLLTTNNTTNSKVRDRSRAVKKDATSKTPVNASATNTPDIGGGGGSSKHPQDRSQLNFPYDIRVHGFASILNSVQKATPKVRRVLMEECDLIMECRYCRNLFRSVPNFLTHKQNYCKSMFHPSSENGLPQCVSHANDSSTYSVDYNFDTSRIDSLRGPRDLHTSYTTTSFESEQSKADTMNLAVNEEDSSSRASASLYNGLNAKVKMDEDSSKSNSSGQIKLVLDPVNGRDDMIMYQTRVSTDPSICDSSENVYDVREIIERDTAILGPDGKVMCTGTARGIEKIVKHLTAQIDFTQRKMVQESTNQFLEKCDICKTVFSSEKAMRQHRRDAPDCVRQSQSAGKISGNKRSTEISNDADSVGYRHGQSPSSQKKRTKADEKEEANLTSSFVKKLFANPGSPVKRSSVSSLSPIKPPKYAKKSSSAKTESKTSPYKKALGKAVKQMQMPNKGQSTSIIETLKKTGIHLGQTSELPFSCVRCDSNFKNQSEMAMHLVKCSAKGTINLSLLRHSAPVQRKISIEIRHNYSKSSTPTISNNSINLREYDSTGKKLPTPTKLSTFPNKKSLIAASATAKRTSLDTKQNSNYSYVMSKNPSSKTDPVKTEHESSSIFDSRMLGPENCQSLENVESNKQSNIKSNLVTDNAKTLESIDSNDNLPGSKSSGDINERKGNSLDNVLTKNGNTSSSSSSRSESDVDREGNATDSGISSSCTTTTNVEEGHHHDNQEDSPTAEAEDAPTTSSSKRTKSGAKSKKTASADDRVLTPKNKNLRLTVASRKRKSHRIQKRNDNSDITKNLNTAVRKTK